MKPFQVPGSRLHGWHLAAAICGVLAAGGTGWAADAATHFARAEAFHADGNTRDALREYDAVLALGGEDAAARHNRALIFLEVGDIAMARTEAGKAAALAPREGRYRVTFAATWMAGEDADLAYARTLLLGALKLLDKARDHAGLDAAYYNLGVAAQRMRRNGEACKYYQLALEQNPADERAAAALDAISPSTSGPTKYR